MDFLIHFSLSEAVIRALIPSIFPTTNLPLYIFFTLFHIHVLYFLNLVLYVHTFVCIHKIFRGILLSLYNDKYVFPANYLVLNNQLVSYSLVMTIFLTL